MTQEDEAASAAFDILKEQPGWASVQERLSQANVSELREFEQLTDAQERRDTALKSMDFQAETYLDLVSDSATADAFCSVLPIIARTANVRYCGRPRQLAEPVSPAALDFEREVQLRAQDWAAKAYRRAQTLGVEAPRCIANISTHSLQGGGLTVGRSDWHERDSNAQLRDLSHVPVGPRW